MHLETLLVLQTWLQEFRAMCDSQIDLLAAGRMNWLLTPACLREEMQ